MKCVVAKPEDILRLSDLSVKVGNVPFTPGHCAASLLVNGDEILGFAAAATALHAAGSWVHPTHRRNGWTHLLRAELEDELRRLGIPFYFSVPNTEFERELFKKYGPVDERLVQVRSL